MSVVREWGATFWADEDEDQATLDMFAGLVEHLLRAEVPDAVILERSAKGMVPAPWMKAEDGFQFVGVLIKYTSEQQDAA